MMNELESSAKIIPAFNQAEGLFNKEIDLVPVAGGIGIKILNVTQFTQELKEKPNVLTNFFTSGEIRYCAGRFASLAGRMAAKQAIVEMIGADEVWQDIEILPNEHHCPQVHLRRKILEQATAKNIVALPLSISHDEGHAAAFVVGVDAPEFNLQVGVDIASVKRISDFFQRKQQQFLKKYFTNAEVQETKENVMALTDKWAGKEAVAKALGTGIWREGVAWTDIEILTKLPGLASISLSGVALYEAEKRQLHDWKIKILPHPQTPIAMVVAHE